MKTMILYVIFIFILIWLWIKSKFWNRQPMSHVYNLPKSGILSLEPTLNKYVDIHNVRFYQVNELTEIQKKEIYEYVKEKQPSFHKQSHLFGYLKKAYLSIYRDSNGVIGGCITSRHVTFTLNKVSIDAYYTDFVFADTSFILKKIIQTHEYIKHTHCPLSIFSSSKISFLVPLTTYSIAWVHTSSFQKYKFPLKIRILKAVPETLISVYDCFKKPFQCQMIPSIYQLSKLIQSKNISIYYIYNPYLVAVLFFKNTYELYNDLSIVDWIGTLLLDKKNMDIVKNVISTILHGIQSTFKVVRIHQVSDTPSYSSFKKTECVKYVYNYGISSIAPSKCLFI